MLTDVPCCCTTCGLMYSARERMVSDHALKKKPAEEFGRELTDRQFNGLECEGANCGGEDYRLLLGPLFVPRD